jgi:plastocyanin
MKNAILVSILLGILFLSGCSGSKNQATTTLLKATTTVGQPTTTLQQATTTINLAAPTTTLTQTTLSTTSTISTGPKTYYVQIKNFAFNPMVLNIKKGDTVTWINMDNAPHQVVSDSGSEISSDTLSNAKKYTKVFNTAGTFNYHCSIHQLMKGSIVVE